MQNNSNHSHHSSTFGKTQNLTTGALIAALYVALTFVFSGISFGFLQVRIAEAFTIFAVFSPLGGWAVTFSCFLSNVIGFATGANILGFPDIIFGTLATGVAAWLSYRLRNIRWKGLPVLSTLPPVLLNALVVGAELTAFSVLQSDSLRAGGYGKLFLLNAVQVGIGQFVSCTIFGLILFVVLERTGLAKKYLEE